jgi:acyl-CoA synthetase (AMP-forming)/AMP-acid ligase II
VAIEPASHELLERERFDLSSLRTRSPSASRPSAGSTRTEADLVAACRGRIATYKIPRYWKLVDAFPMTVTGKIQKFRIREIALAEFAR